MTRIAFVGALLFALVPPCALAQTILSNQVHTVASATSPAPVEHDFSISSNGTYTVTLTDLGANQVPAAPLQSVMLAVTSGSGLVGKVLSGAGSIQLTATPGTYTLHVVGQPGNGLGSGAIGMTVAAADGTPIWQFSDTLATPATPLPGGEGVIDGTIEVATADTYTVTLSDLALPQALGVKLLALVPQGGTPIVTLPDGGGNYQAQVALTPGTYRIFAVGQAGGSAPGGLFNARVVANTSGQTLYTQTVPLGGTVLLGSPYLGAGTYSLTTTDLGVPASLSLLAGALVSKSGQAVAQLPGAGSQSFSASSAGNFDLFALAVPGGQAGGYAVEVKPQSGASILSLARAVSAPGSSYGSYAFDATLTASGAYTLTSTDFNFPALLTSLNLVAVQGAQKLASASSAGNLSVNASAGPLTVLAFAQGGVSGGLFGLQLATSGAAPVLDVTQGVGSLFASSAQTFAANGNIDVTANDLGFPSPFSTLAVLVTQGANKIGSVFTTGTFRFAATSGATFHVNLIAQPAANVGAGTYALTIAQAPPVPVVAFSANLSEVTSGGTATLTWSSQNATSCAASGGWSGNQATSGSATTAAITTATTFTLACTGGGGTTTQSVSITVRPASSGGGGALDWETSAMAAIAGWLALRRRSMHVARR